VGSKPVFINLNYFLFYPEISRKIKSLDIIWPRDHLIKLEAFFYNNMLQFKNTFLHSKLLFVLPRN
jgi:hypothetical protein